MLLTVGREVSVPVDIINVSSPALRTREGRVRRFADAVYEIELTDDAPDLEVGTRVVLNLRDGGRRRVTAIVESHKGRELRVLERSASTPDKRIYPRLAGGIPLRYRVLSTDEDVGAAHPWLLGEDDDAEATGAWRSPDPFMNFSVTGLRFDDAQACAAGDRLLCEFGVPGDQRRWRALARVVRLDPIPTNEPTDDGATHHVAVAFEQLPDAAAEALTQYTLRLQRAHL
jgi:hypothetical protein